MNPEPQHRVTAIELWLEWTDPHGVRYDDAGKSSDEIATDHFETRDAYRILLAPDRSGMTSAAHEAAANSAFAAAIERWGGELEPHSAVQVLDPEGRIAPRRATPDAGGEFESIATPSAAHQEVMQPHDFPTEALRP